MTEAETILSLIEKAHFVPHDCPDEIFFKKLDEIDARVYIYLKLNEDFKTSISGRSITYRHKSWKPEDRSVLFHLFDEFQYTRSRDDLKKIRPEGWHFHANSNSWLLDNKFFHGHGFKYTDSYKEYCASQIDTDGCGTEELAELHAIIQAIEYERGQNAA